MANKTKTEADVVKETEQMVVDVEKGRRMLAVDLQKEEKVPVKIPPLYKPYFGKVMTISINGISCAIPVDGQTYHVPKTFAEEANVRMFRQDELIQKQAKMSDAVNNKTAFESYPGELALF